MMKRLAITMLAVAATALTATASHAGDLSGAGSTAIYPVLAKWSDEYHKESGVAVNYQAIGSGGGIAQIKAKTVDFGATDKPLKPEELDQTHLTQFPAVIISITPVVNLPGVKPGDLTLSGPVLADIYLGKITSWDAPEIKKLNPNIKLPNTKITTVHRSDGSGTTFNFTDYLSKVSPEWDKTVGEDVSVSWPNGVGGKGNAGVASYVQQIQGAVGYVEYAYVMENHLVYTKMVNKAGKTVEPTMEAFQAAAANADFSKVKNFYLILTDQPGEQSWPITGSTWLLMRVDYPPAQNQGVLKFSDWFLKHGQAQAKALDYVPMPDSVVAQIEKDWQATFKGADGKPIWTAMMK
jgi:phosphate transport system substrate-binding protein